MTKIVLDTNVLINGFKDENSFEKRIINEVIAGKVEAFANRQTLRENKLISSQLIENEDYQKDLQKLFSQINWVINKRQIKIVRDPEDNKILESAAEAEAEYLITSDNDLLTLGAYKNTQIINPSQFWAKYKDDGMDLWKQWAKFITKQ
ncbi:MAG: putative toxin-antitoxin system toxin component, PIN family [Candidatus Doudnabacteria bacterium]|jgi:putative PIN family toxin of toxin-antitoxin system